MTGSGEHRCISFDQTPLFYRRVVPSGRVKAVLFLLHGMGEHGGRYVPLAEHLAKQGIECWISDLRGFGKSGGPRGFIRHFSDLEEDLKTLYSLAERTHRGLPLYLFGHSFGGLLAISFLKHCRPARLKGVILSSPLFGIALPVPIWQNILGCIASVVAPSFSQNNRINADLLTHDPSMRLSHRSDPLIHFQISARLYTEMRRAIAKIFREAPKFECPLLLLQAGDDRIVSKQKNLAFYERISSPDKELEVYDGWYHEILNEVDRHLIFERITSWLLKRI